MRWVAVRHRKKRPYLIVEFDLEIPDGLSEDIEGTATGCGSEEHHKPRRSKR